MYSCLFPSLKVFQLLAWTFQTYQRCLSPMLIVCIPMAILLPHARLSGLLNGMCRGDEPKSFVSHAVCVFAEGSQSEQEGASCEVQA